MLGGNSQEKDAAGNEWKPTLDGFKEIVSTKVGRDFGSFEAVKFTQQVVNGNVFHVKYLVDGSYIHAKIYNPLPHTGLPSEC